MVIVVSSSSGGADAVGRETLADLVLIPRNMVARNQIHPVQQIAVATPRRLDAGSDRVRRVPGSQPSVGSVTLDHSPSYIILPIGDTWQPNGSSRRIPISRLSYQLMLPKIASTAEGSDKCGISEHVESKAVEHSVSTAPLNAGTKCERVNSRAVAERATGFTRTPALGR